MITKSRISPDDITFIRSLIKEHPGWHRTRLSREICQSWDWTNEAERLKDMAAWSLLRKLDVAGLIELSARVQLAHNHLRFREGGERPNYQVITGCLADLRPVRIVPVDSGPRAKLFRGLLSHYHYLGYSGQDIRVSTPCATPTIYGNWNARGNKMVSDGPKKYKCF